MQIDSQEPILAAMQNPDFYPHPVSALSLCETHVSRVFLTGDFVYKIKKPVELGFLDFRSLEDRRRFCRQEVDLNRRLTRDVYLDVVAITRQDDQYALDGPGRPLEYAVKMRQLPENALMTRQLSTGKIDASAIEALARILTDFYRTARRGPAIDAMGSKQTVEGNCEENFSQLEEFTGKYIDERQMGIIRDATRAFLRKQEALFARRIAEGKIRECHGDLRTDSIYFTDDGIQIIDCIEFNERFRFQDSASDLAFLTMDLDFQGFTPTALALLEAYTRRSQDHDFVVLLDFYKCYRAVVRAKVNCMRLEQGNLSSTEQGALIRETRRYTDLACQYAHGFADPRLWVVCGRIAAGKSTVARALADALGLQLLRSDVVRKDLFGSRTPGDEPPAFGKGIYTDDAGARTYAELVRLAREAVRKGDSVILDATFSLRAQRGDLTKLAQELGVEAIFVECNCREALAKERLRARENRATVSDARLEHWEQLKARYEAPEEIPADSLVQIDTENDLEANIGKILSRGVQKPSL